MRCRSMTSSVRQIRTHPYVGMGFIHEHFVGFSPPCRTVSACAEHLRDHLEGTLDILRIDPVAGNEPYVSSAACIRPESTLRALVKEACYRNSVDFEDHEVGLNSPKVELDAFDLSKAFRQRFSVGMVLGQTVHHMIEGVQTGCGEHSDLAHPAPEHLSPSPGLCNFRVGPDQNASSRGAQALRKAEGQCVGAGGEVLYIRIDGDGSIENSSAIEVHSDSTISSQLRSASE